MFDQADRKNKKKYQIDSSTERTNLITTATRRYCNTKYIPGRNNLSSTNKDMTDGSTAASMSVAAAAAASSSPPSLDVTNANFSISESMVSFLRMEAHQADEKAKRLRKQAAELASQFGITEESLQSYELGPTELPPLDEKGFPKYRGKKRGRKPKEKKRKTNPDRPKRKHTGYTLFMQEVYPVAKSEYPSLPPKELISIVARRWKDLEMDSRTAWKERARQSIVDVETKPTGNEDRVETAATGTHFSYPTSKDIDPMKVLETRDKDMDENATETGIVSNPPPRGIIEEEDEENHEDLIEG